MRFRTVLMVAAGFIPPAPASGATPVLSGTLSPAYLNTAYFGFLSIAGGTAPFTVNITGTPPPGLVFTPSTSTVSVTGSPTSAGTGLYNFTVSVTDALLATSNTVTFTGFLVNVFSASTFSAKMGQRNRARTGAILGAYLGDPLQYATDLTIVSGNSTGHWQVQSRTTSVPPGSTTSIPFTVMEGGLSPRGNGTGGNTHLTSAWPGTAGGSLQTSYSVVVQHTATGQQCTINIDVDPATTKTWNNRVYNLGNAYVVATEYECRNFGTTGPNNFITRNATEGGWIILRNGASLGTADPILPNFWIGEGSYASGSVAFSPGTFSKNNTVDGNSIFQSTHGDGVSGRIVEGWQGGNWTLVSPETFKGAKIANMQVNTQGMMFVGVEFITGANNATTFGLQPQVSDTVVDCCEFHCAPNPAAGNKFGFRGDTSSPYPNMTALNSYFYDLDNAYQTWIMDMYAAGNLFDRIRSDCINGAADPGDAKFTGTANCWVAFNILINANVAAGAHPDFFQFYFTGSGGLTPSGTITVEKNMGLTSSQFVYSAGGAATTNRITIVDRNNMNISGKHIWSHTSAYAGQMTATCNTSLQDFDGPDYDNTVPPGHVVGTSNVNVTIQDNVAQNFVSGSVSGTLILSSTSNTSSGDNKLMTATNAAYASAFTSALAVGGGGLPALTASIHSWQAAWNLGFPYFVPKNALAGAGGLKRAGGTGPGAVAPGSTASAPIWNVNNLAW